MKLADYVAIKLAAFGIKDVFTVTGGAAMHLNQSLGGHPSLRSTYCHHEQACAIAAESYYRINNQLAVVSVTSGPGGTNAISGVFGAWTDSIGMIVLSGQVKRETTTRFTRLDLRQFGDQELDIEKLVSPITKYCTMVTDPMTIRYHLEKALYLAISGRPGPCWLDIPIDVQAADIDADALQGFDPAQTDLASCKKDMVSKAKKIVDALSASQRPVIVAGWGIRLSGQYDAFLDLIGKLDVPVVTSFNGHDVLWFEHPKFVGRPGTIGDRSGNFAVQNADLLLVLGSRLNIRQVSYNYTSFARAAYKICVDIDPQELLKPTLDIDFPIVADLRWMIPALLEEVNLVGPNEAHRDWLIWCKERHLKYPVVLDEYWKSELVNPYCFMKTLFDKLPKGQAIVSGNATACIVSFQAGELKPGQRHWSNSGSASMGYDLPAAVGACRALDEESVICIAGDGSIMMNLQELQTISSNRLNIKIFVLNNDGYHSISQTHRNFFNGNEFGAGPRSGVVFPDFAKVANSFNIPYFHCSSHTEMSMVISKVLAESGSAICEVSVDASQPFAPRLASRQLPSGRIVSAALEDLTPLLSHEELHSNMLIPLVDNGE